MHITPIRSRRNLYAPEMVASAWNGIAAEAWLAMSQPFGLASLRL